YVVAVIFAACALGCFITSLNLLTGKELYESSNIKDTTDQQHVEEGTVQNFQMEVPEDKGSIVVEFLSSVLNRIPVRVQKFFQCFCPILNTMGLFHVKDSSDQVQCLDGIRLFDSLWVILSHTLGYLLPVLGCALDPVLMRPLCATVNELKVLTSNASHGGEIYYRLDVVYVIQNQG
ncbi:hypothetical protein AVEN_60357-1, partial [Araneus ventricosus]